MQDLVLEDLKYYLEISNQNVEKIVAEMSYIINENEVKIEELKNQNWFKRMIKTVFGKNKVTLDEIKKNKDKLNIYVIEIILELNKKGMIDHQILLLLNEKLNTLFKKINNLTLEHSTLVRDLRIITEELNKQIQSLDNYTTIIYKKSIYEKMNSISAIADILSKLDSKNIFNEEKIEIIYENMDSWLNNKTISLEDLFENIVKLSEDELNIIYLKLNNFRNDILIDLVLEIIERKNYFCQNSENIIKELFFENRIDGEYLITTKYLFLKLLNSKKEYLKDCIDTEEKLVIDTIDFNKKLQDSSVDYLIFKAENGDRNSQYEVGKYYLKRAEYIESYYWFERASQQGEVNSIFNLALLYKEGLGVNRDSVKGYKYLKEASFLGEENAKKLLKI